MAKFKFKFDSVNKVKQNLEKKVKRELAIVNMEINNISLEIEQLYKEKEKVRQGAFNNSRIRANELQAQLNYENFVDELIKSKKEKKAEKEIEKGKIIEELAMKKKEVKIFDSLKDKHYQNYLVEENKAELSLLDDIASKRLTKA
ncbi:MAG TPA: flagellar export protein FliJ [Ignavibacteriaceae bacterium]|jgi:flagellar export protein FliJ|nr:flagellar export protein FliJ [Ignavibacteriaceae bacterium]